MDSLARYTSWFRGSTPYISAHRGKTFVVFLGGEALAHANLVNTVHDLALLNVLGVRVVQLHGGRRKFELIEIFEQTNDGVLERSNK